MYIVTKQKYLCCFLKYLNITSVVYNDRKPHFNCVVTVRLLISHFFIVFTACWIGLWVYNQIAHRFT